VKCSACKERLSAYQDGDLAPREAALVAAHLASCAECSAFSQRLADAESSLIRLAPIEPAPDFTLAVMAKIAAMPLPARRPARIWWLLAADIVIWLAIGAFTALGAIRWKVIAAAAVSFAAKVGVAGTALFDVAQHLHIASIAVLGVGLEVAFIVLLIVAGRKYLSRIRGNLSGVLS
jgi:anti-sigma factor RsiW